MKISSRNIAKGFVSLELMVALVLLCILAAFLLTSFLSIQREARITKAHSLFASIRSTSLLARARCELDLAQTTTPAENAPLCRAVGKSTILMDTQVVAMSNKYPDYTLKGILAALQILGVNSEEIPDKKTTNGLILHLNAPTETLTIQIAGAEDLPTCQISYQSASYDAPKNVYVSPSVKLITSGC